MKKTLSLIFDILAYALFIFIFIRLNMLFAEITYLEGILFVLLTVVIILLLIQKLSKINNKNNEEKNKKQSKLDWFLNVCSLLIVVVYVLTRFIPTISTTIKLEDSNIKTVSLKSFENDENLITTYSDITKENYLLSTKFTFKEEFKSSSTKRPYDKPHLEITCYDLKLNSLTKHDFDALVKTESAFYEKVEPQKIDGLDRTAHIYTKGYMGNIFIFQKQNYIYVLDYYGYAKPEAILQAISNEFK